MNRHIFNLRLLLSAIAVASAAGQLDAEQVQHAVEAAQEDVDRLEALLNGCEPLPGTLTLPLLTLTELAEEARRRSRPTLTLLAGGAA